MEEIKKYNNWSLVIETTSTNQQIYSIEQVQNELNRWRWEKTNCEERIAFFEWLLIKCEEFELKTSEEIRQEVQEVQEETQEEQEEVQEEI